MTYFPTNTLVITHLINYNLFVISIKIYKILISYHIIPKCLNFFNLQTVQKYNN